MCWCYLLVRSGQESERACDSIYYAIVILVIEWWKFWNDFSISFKNIIWIKNFENIFY